MPSIKKILERNQLVLKKNEELVEKNKEILLRSCEILWQIQRFDKPAKALILPVPSVPNAISEFATECPREVRF